MAAAPPPRGVLAADAAVDVDRSDAEQDRAATLLLAEDALVHGVKLFVAGGLSFQALR